MRKLVAVPMIPLAAKSLQPRRPQKLVALAFFAVYNRSGQSRLASAIFVRPQQGDHVMCAKQLIALGAILFAGLAALAPAAEQAKAGKDRDFETLAENVVKQSARITEGDLVQIAGSFKDAPLLEALAVNVRKQGGIPLITAGSERLARRMFDDVPAKFDSQLPEFELKLAGIMSALVSVSSQDEDVLAGVPAERLAAVQKAASGVGPILLKRNVRTVEIGNGLYPTPSRAQQFGLSEADLAKVFWDGLNVDYSKMQNVGTELSRILSAGKEVHVTAANGTDLKVRIEKKTPYVSDGVLTAEKQKKGGPNCQMWLPAGEVYVAAVPDSAEGKVVIDRYFYMGKMIEGLTLTFKAGKMTAMSAKSGDERLQAAYKASAGPGKDRFAIIDFGINPNVRIPENSKLLSYMPAGMVTITTGNDTWAGGDNNSTFGLAGFLPRSTVRVDNRVIVENGALKI
jgi:aminopeptidase